MKKVKEIYGYAFDGEWFNENDHDILELAVALYSANPDKAKELYGECYGEEKGYIREIIDWIVGKLMDVDFCGEEFFDDVAYITRKEYDEGEWDD